MKKSIIVVSFMIFIISFSLIWSEMSDRYLSYEDAIQNPTNDNYQQDFGNSRTFSAPVGSIFTQLPHNTTDSWSFGTSEVEAGFTVAENYWGLEDFSITGIRFWGFSLVNPWASCSTENPMTFEFTFYEDDSNSIGSIVSQFTATPTMTQTDSLYAGFICYEFEITFPNVVFLPEGWISIQGQTADPNCWFLWASSPTGDGDSYQYVSSWELTGFDRGFSLVGEEITPPDPLAGSGKCLEFDGVNEYVDFADWTDSQFNLAQLTVEAWVKADAVKNNMQIISKGYDGSNTEWELKTTTAGGKVSFRRWNGSGIGAESTSELVAGRWTHIAGTFDGAEWKIYWNGILENTVADAGIVFTDNEVHIGAVDNNGTPDQFWEGAIDEVLIWDTELTESEIRADMCHKLTGNESGLLAYWRLDESTGTFCYDYTGNGNHGIMYNMEDPDDHVWSGAPIGDVSDYDYSGSREFAYVSLYGDTFRATVTDTNVVDPFGIHVYGVQEPPNFNESLDCCPTYIEENYSLTDSVYFGVFIVEGETAPPTRYFEYQVDYTYGPHPELDAQCTYDLFKRDNNADSTWIYGDADHNMTDGKLIAENSYSCEFIIGSSDNLYACGDYEYDFWWEDIDTVFVECDVIIPPEVTLTISPGTYVEFQSNETGGLRCEAPGIWCEGSIIAEGTSTDEITFTIDDPLNNSWTGIHLLGDEMGIPVREGNASLFNYCIIEHVFNIFNYDGEYDIEEQGIGAGISMWNYPECEISNSTIRGCFGLLGGGISALGGSYPNIHDNNIYYNFSLIGGGIAVEDISSLDVPEVRDVSQTVIEGNDIHHNIALLSGGGIHLMDLYMFMNAFNFGLRDLPEEYQYQVVDNNIHENYAVSLYYLLDYFLDGQERTQEISHTAIKETFNKLGLEYNSKMQKFIDNLDQIPIESNNSRYFTNLLAFGGGGVFASYVDVNLDGNTIENNATMAYLDDAFMDPPFFYYDGPFDVERIALGCGAGVLLRGFSLDYTFFGTGPYRSLPPYRPVLNNNEIINNKIEILPPYFSEEPPGPFRIFENSVYASAMGAGVFSIDTRPTLTDNLISGNEIGVIDSTTILADFFLVRNDGDRNSNYFPAFGFGGGVCQIAATIDTTAFVVEDTVMTINPGFVMDNNEVTNNKAFFGAGIATLGINFSELTDNTIEYNETFSGYDYFDPEQMTRDSLEVFFGIGGGIYDEGVMSIQGGSLSHNTATMGGGICNSYYSGPWNNVIMRDIIAPLSIDDCDIEDNLASGLFNGYYISENDTTFYYDFAAGGGVLIKSFEFGPVAWYLFEDYWGSGERNSDREVYYGDIIITNCNINNNKANRIGGGVHVAKDAFGVDLVVNGSEFHDNYAPRGGALCYQRNPFFGYRPPMMDFGTVDIKNSNFLHNTAEYIGGAVYVGDAFYTKIEDCLFEDNEAYSEWDYPGIRFTEYAGYGGAVALENLQNAALINNEFSLNRAYMGGAISIESYLSDFMIFPGREYIDEETQYEGINLINNLIYENTADNLGGGIYCDYILQTGGIHVNSPDEFPVFPGEVSFFTNIYNNTIADNNAYYGGGVCIIDEISSGLLGRSVSKTRFLNSILWGNYAEGDTYGSQIEVYEYQNGIISPFQRYLDDVIQIDYCDIQGGYDLIYYDGNEPNRYYSIIDRDPEFRNPNNGNYQLQETSPCINVGDPDTSSYVYTEYDLAGNPRIFDGEIDRIDLGCYEFLGDVVLDSDIFYLEDVVENDLELCCDTVYVIGDVEIPDTVTVTICPGTTVIFVTPEDIDEGGIQFRDSYTYAIDVYGTLIAIGSPDSVITFTAEDTEYGWGGIRIWGEEEDPDSSRFEYCYFEYGTDEWSEEWDRSGKITKKEKEPEISSSSDSARDRSYYGGALYLYESNAVIDNCEFAYNEAEDGGAIYVDYGGPTISNTYMHHNLAYDEGGAVFLYETEETQFFNNTLINNTANYYSGAMEIEYCADLVITDCVFDSNATVEDDRISDQNVERYDSGDGGCIYIYQSEGLLTFENCSFNYNSSYNHAGAIYVDNRADVDFYNCEMLGNIADKDGGAIHARRRAKTRLFNCNISYNEANKGGGLSLRDPDDDYNGEYRLFNTIISHNTARYGGGVHLYYGNKFIAINSNICDNYASEDGGGIWVYDCDVNLTNTILWGNEADNDGDQIYDDDYRIDLSIQDQPDNRRIRFRNSIVEEYYEGLQPINETQRYLWTFTSINLDPQFVNADSGNYNLMDNSPAINTGTPDTTGLDLGEFDLNGDPRIYEGNIPRIDIGCYEYQGDPRIQYLFDGFAEDTYLCADSIYVYCDPYIPEDVSVIICPGTVVQHMNPFGGPYRDRDRGYGYFWVIEGCLFAVGTELERITFTAEYPVFPAWSGLYFIYGDNDFYTSRLKYCDVEYVNNWYGPQIPYENFYNGYDNGFNDLWDLINNGAAINLYEYSNLRISETEFRYNLGVLGGGIGVHKNSYPYIQDNLFHENFALGGGGIYWSPNQFEYLGLRDANRPIIVDSTFRIENNTFNDNWAVSGGGIYLQQHLDEFYDGGQRFDLSMDVEVAHNEFNRNISVGNLFLEEVFPLLDSLGVYDPSGLPIYDEYLNYVTRMDFDVSATYQQLFGNDSRFQIWSGGGGIFSGNLSPYIHDNELNGNGALGIYDESHYDNFMNVFASRGGGILAGLDPFFYNYGQHENRDLELPKATISGNLIEDNFTFSRNNESLYLLVASGDYYESYVAIGSGAGVYNAHQYLDLTENTILNNEIMIEDNDSFYNRLQDSEDSRSTIFGFAGGGVYHLEPGYYSFMQEDEFEHVSLIQSNIIEGNSALYGGGIAVDRPGEPFDNDYAFDNVGSWDYFTVISNNLIANNTANWDDHILEFLVEINHHPYEGSGTNPGGGGIFVGPQLFCVMLNNTIADNVGYFGGGLLNSFNLLYAENNIFWGNQEHYGEEYYPGQISFWGEDVIFAYNDVQDGEQGIYWDMPNGITNSERYWFGDNNNINADPVFAGSSPHPYMLVDSSPCANAGNPAITMENLGDWYLPEFDLRGDPANRIYDSGDGGIIDIGAYETGNNPPYDIILGNPASVPENEAPGYLVGQLTTEDLDELDTHTYSLVPGEGDDFNDCFEIIGDELFTTCELNYEDLLNPVRGNVPLLSAEKSNERKGAIDLNTGTENTRPVLPNAWINEIHYDNTGTDAGEFVEVVLDNDFGFDLSLLDLLLYNGSNGEIYNFESGLALIPGASYGQYSFYRWDFPSNGIQNGSPDGLGLMYEGHVIQFISYEGSFTAVDGPAAGMTSTDIGVSETSSTPTEFSLQLVDPGRTSFYGDYIWAGPMAETPGAINTGQTLDVPPPVIGVTVRVRTTDDGENNMYYEEEMFIGVIDMNDDPLFDIIPEEFTFDEDGSSGPIDFDPFIHDEDVDGVRVVNNLTLEVSGNTNVIVDITDLVVTFTAVEDWFGEEMLTFTVNDGWARAIASDSVLVVVGPVDDEPEINVPDSLWATIFTSNEDGPIVFDFGPYISQAWGETDDVILTCVGQFPGSIPEMDEINVVINGFVVTFTPQENQFGMMIVDFMVSDGITRIINDKIKKDRTGEISISSGSDNNRIIYETIHVTFEPVNDPPILEVPIALEAMEDDSSEVYDFTPYISQTWGEFDPVTLTSSGSEHIDVFIDGFEVVIASNTLNWSGEEDIVFTVDDSIYTRLASTEISSCHHSRL